MDIIITILQPQYLGDIENDKLINHKPMSMANDYEQNPILTYLPTKVLVNDKMIDATEFYLKNGLVFISPVPVYNFQKVKKNIINIRKAGLYEDSITAKWQSIYLQSGNSSLILN